MDGQGDKNEADGAAVTAMRYMLNTIAMDGTVVIGEGEKDEAPMLFNGERLGSGFPEVDIAVDPIDGTRLTAMGLPGAISVVALLKKEPCMILEYFYMNKATGPDAAES